MQYYNLGKAQEMLLSSFLWLREKYEAMNMIRRYEPTATMVAKQKFML